MIAQSQEERKRIFEMMIDMKAIRYSRENAHVLDDYKGTDKDWLHEAFVAGFEACLDFQNSHRGAEEVLKEMIQEEINLNKSNL